MNQELKDMTQEKLTQYLEVLENSVTTGAELAQQEIPLLAQEILNWEFYSHLIIGLSLLLVSFLISLVVRLIYKHYKNISTKLSTARCIDVKINTLQHKRPH